MEHILMPNEGRKRLTFQLEVIAWSNKVVRAIGDCQSEHSDKSITDSVG